MVGHKFIFPIVALSLAIAAGAVNARDEMIVEAQRRAQDVQDVPVAVTAVDAAELERLQVIRLEDIDTLVPNLQTYQVTANGAAMQVHARGASVQNPGFITSESPVGLYEDDVYRGRLATANLDLTDIERIEVLRGPQSTLYGRNTIAGAIKIYTRTPDDEAYGNASLGYGNFDTSRLAAAVGGPLIDGTLAASVAGSYNKREKGWIKNPNTGVPVGEYENAAARGKVHWYDNENFNVTLTGWLVDVTNDGYNGIPYNPMFGTGSVPGAPQSGFYDNWSPAGSNFGSSEQAGATLDIDYDFGALTFRSITAYVDIDDLFGFDLAGGGNTQTSAANPGGVFPPGTPGLLIKSGSNMEQLSQEFHLLGTALNDSLDWIAGFYYLNEDGKQDYSGIGFPFDFLENTDTETDSYAVFAEGTWQFADRWSATFGLRYTDEDKTFMQTCQGNTGGTGSCVPDSGGNFNLNLKRNFDQWTPRAIVNYMLGDDTLLYASISTGFQAGGFQTLCFGNLSCAENTYEPQDVISYELGYKGTLAEDTMTFNAAAFLAQYGDIQQTAISAGAFPTQNVGDADVIGLELEWNWTPIDDLNIYANAGFMSSDYKRLIPNSCAALAGAKELPSNPEFTSLLGFDYSVAATSLLDIFFGADVYYSDEYFTECTNSLPIDSYSRINGFIGVGHPDRTWQLVAEGKNLGDSEDNVSGLFVQDDQNFPPTFGVTNIRTVLPPRTYLVSLKFNF